MKKKANRKMWWNKPANIIWSRKNNEQKERNTPKKEREEKATGKEWW